MLTMKHTKSKNYSHLVLLLIFLALSFLFVLPLFKWHYIPFGDDMDFHIDRVLELKYNIAHFNFFPELATYTFRRTAYPINIFYPWVTIIPFAVFQLIIPNQVWGFYFGFMFYAFVGLVLTYTVTKKVTSKRSAFFTSVGYIFSEYMAIDAFRRFDLGEFLGMIFLPLVIYGFYAIMFGNKKDWPFLGFGMALIAMSHILSTFMVIVLLAALFIVLVWWVKEKKQTFFKMVKAALLALGASSVSIIPLIIQSLTQRFPSQTCDISSGFNIQGLGTLLITSLNSDCNNFYYGIGVVDVLIAFLGLIFFTKLSKISKASYIIGSITFFMASTAFPWELFDKSIFSIIQFPFRLLAFTSLFYAVVGGEITDKAISKFSDSEKKMQIVLSVTALLLFVVPQIGQTQLMLRNTDNFRKQINGRWFKKTYGRFFKNSRPYTQFTSFQFEMYAPKNESQGCPYAFNHVVIIDGKNVQLKPAQIISGPNKITYNSDLINNAKGVTLPVIYYNYILKATRNGKKVPIRRSPLGLIQVNSNSYGPITISYRISKSTILSIILTFLCWGIGLIIFIRKKYFTLT